MLKKAIAVGLFVVVFGLPMKMILFDTGIGRHFYKHLPGKCSKVKTFGSGSEDFQILSSGMTFITSGLFLPIAHPNMNKHGRDTGGGSLQLLDMNNPSQGAKKLNIRDHTSDFIPQEFRPHGLSVLEDKVKGEHIIYVVNHPEGKPDRVEKFVFVPKTKELRHVKSIFSEIFNLINDVAVVTEDKLYISNWLYFTNPILSKIEHLYKIPLGAILFYDGKDVKPITTERLTGPNGIIVSKDHRFLYVTLPGMSLLQVYKRGGASGNELQLMQQVPSYTGLDNFHLSETGDALYGGCHPIPYKLMFHMEDPSTTKAPSQVLRIPLNKDGLIDQEGITEELYDHGDLISGSSIAGVYKGKLLIGSVIEDMAWCQLPGKL